MEYQISGKRKREIEEEVTGEEERERERQRERGIVVRLCNKKRGHAPGMRSVVHLYSRGYPTVKIIRTFFCYNAIFNNKVFIGLILLLERRPVIGVVVSRVQVENERRYRTERQVLPCVEACSRVFIVDACKRVLHKLVAIFLV